MIDPNLIMVNVLKNHHDADKWGGSLFEHIRRVPNTKVGDVGQDFIEELCGAFKLNCNFPLNTKGQRAKQSPWDIKIGNISFELKTATEDVSGAFQFNHIRYHRSYDAVLCLGVSPSKIYFNVWSKAEVTTGKAGRLVSMEKGANASYKLTKRPDSLLSISDFYPRLTKFIGDFKG